MASPMFIFCKDHEFLFPFNTRLTLKLWIVRFTYPRTSVFSRTEDNTTLEPSRSGVNLKNENICDPISVQQPPQSAAANSEISGIICLAVRGAQLRPAVASNPLSASGKTIARTDCVTRSHTRLPLKPHSPTAHAHTSPVCCCCQDKVFVRKVPLEDF